MVQEESMDTMGMTGVVVFLFAICMFVACAMLVGAITLYVAQRHAHKEYIVPLRFWNTFFGAVVEAVQMEQEAYFASLTQNQMHVDWKFMETRTFACPVDYKYYPCGHIAPRADTDGDCPKCEMDKDLLADGYLWAEDNYLDEQPAVDSPFDQSEEDIDSDE
jgi:hypothetical protein